MLKEIQNTAEEKMKRMQKEHPDKTIIWPGDDPKICPNMTKATLWKVAWVLENWLEGTPVNVVKTEPQYVESAYLALKSLLN